MAIQGQEPRGLTNSSRHERISVGRGYGLGNIGFTERMRVLHDGDAKVETGENLAASREGPQISAEAKIEVQY